MKSKKIILIIIFICSVFYIAQAKQSHEIEKRISEIYSHGNIEDSKVIGILREAETIYDSLGISSKLKFNLLMSQYHLQKGDFEKVLHHLEVSEKMIQEIKDKDIKRKLAKLENIYKNQEKKSRNISLKSEVKVLDNRFRTKRILLIIGLLFILFVMLYIGYHLIRIFYKVYTSKRVKLELHRSRKRLENLLSQVDILSKNNLEDSQDSTDVTTHNLEDDLVLKNNIAMFAHDLKNPLAILKSNIQYYKGKFPQDQQSTELSKTILTNIQVITESIQLFLEFTRMEINKVLLHDMKALIRNMVYAEEERFKKIDLKFPDKKIFLKIDRIILENTLSQVLKNSIESKDESVSLEIIVSDSSRFINILIIDDGRGIPFELKQMVFDPFVTTKPYHLGLGLTLARYYLKKIRGQLSIITSSRSGTVVLIQLVKRG